MTTKPQQPPQSEKTPATAEQTPQPPPEPEARKLSVDDVEAEDGDDVKGGGISINTPCQ